MAGKNTLSFLYGCNHGRTKASDSRVMKETKLRCCDEKMTVHAVYTEIMATVAH